MDDNKIKASKNMKKFFKSPEVLEGMTKSDYLKVLKPYLLKEKLKLNETKFVLLSEFKFIDETAPMIFFGTLNVQWKQKINKEYKKRADFCEGHAYYCNTKQENKLKLVIERGKAKTEKHLKDIQKLSAVKSQLDGIYFGELEETIPVAKTAVEQEVEAKQEELNKEYHSKDNATEKLDIDIESKTDIAYIKEALNNFKEAVENSKIESFEKQNRLDTLQAAIKTWKLNPDEKQRAAIEKIEKYINVQNGRLDKLQGREELLFIYKTTKELQSRVDKRKVLSIKGEEYEARKGYLEEVFLLQEDVTSWEINYSKDISSKESQLLEKIKNVLSTIHTKYNNSALEDEVCIAATGYTKERFEEMKKLTQLPTLPSKFIERGTFAKVMQIVKEYNKLPDSDIDGKRLLLWDMIKKVNQDMVDDGNGNKVLQDGNMKKVTVAFTKELYNKINQIAEEQSKEDNYPKVLKLQSQLQDQIQQYENLSEKEKESYKATLIKTTEELKKNCEQWHTAHVHTDRYDQKKRSQNIQHIRIDIDNLMLRLKLTAESVSGKEGYVTKKDKDYTAIEQKYKKIWKEDAGSKTEQEYEFHTKDIQALIDTISSWLVRALLFTENEALIDRTAQINKWNTNLLTLLPLAEIKHSNQEATAQFENALKEYQKIDKNKDKETAKKAILGLQEALNKSIENKEAYLQVQHDTYYVQQQQPDSAIEWIQMAEKREKKKLYELLDKLATNPTLDVTADLKVIKDSSFLFQMISVSDDELKNALVKMSKERGDITKAMKTNTKATKEALVLDLTDSADFKKAFAVDKVDTFVAEKTALFDDVIAKVIVIEAEVADPNKKEDTAKKIIELEQKIEEWDSKVFLIFGDKTEEYTQQMLQQKQELLLLKNKLASYKKMVYSAVPSGIDIREELQGKLDIEQKLYEAIKSKHSGLNGAEDLEQIAIKTAILSLAAIRGNTIADLYTKAVVWFNEGDVVTSRSEVIELLKKAKITTDLDAHEVEIEAFLKDCKSEITKQKTNATIEEIENYKKTVIAIHNEKDNKLEANLEKSSFAELVSTTIKKLEDGEDASIDQFYQDSNEIERKCINDVAILDIEKTAQGLYKFQGESLYNDDSNINNIVDKKEIEDARNLAKLASNRALRLLKLGYSNDSKKIVELIPNTFLPASFVQEKRVFDAIDQKMATTPEEAQLLKVEQDLLSQLPDSWTAITDAVGLAEASDKLANLKEVLEMDTSTLSKYNDFSQGFDAFKGSSDKTIEDFLKSKEGKGLNLTPDQEAKFEAIQSKADSNQKELFENIGKIAFAGGAAIETGVLLNELVNLVENPSQNKKQVALFVNKAIGKVVGDVSSGLSTFGADQTDAGKIVKASLESVKLLASTLSKGEKISPKKGKELVVDVSMGLCEIGAGVADIVSIFIPVAGLISANFTLITTTKDLVVIIKECHAKVQIFQKSKLLRDAAKSEASNFLSATQGVKNQAKQDAVSGAVDVVAQSIKTGAAGLSVAGAVVTLTPVAPIGAAINLSGKIIGAVGGLVKFSKDGIISAMDFVNYHDTKKIIKDARAGNLDAIDKVLTNQITYAKAFLIYGAIDNHNVLDENNVEIRPDKIADHYCKTMNIDLDNISGDQAQDIIGKYIDGTETYISYYTNRFKEYNANLDKVTALVMPAKKNDVTDLTSLGDLLDGNSTKLKEIQEQIKIFQESKNFLKQHSLKSKFNNISDIIDSKQKYFHTTSLVIKDKIEAFKEAENAATKDLKSQLDQANIDIQKINQFENDRKNYLENKQKLKQILNLLPQKA